MKFFNKFLNEEINLNQYPPEIQRAIEARDSAFLGEKIIKEKINAEKDLLLLKGKDGKEVVFWILEYSRFFNSEWYTKDLDVLKTINPETGNSVAYYLIDVLKKKDRKFLMTKEVLMIKNKDGRSIAHELANTSAFHKKELESLDKEILNLKNNFGTSVAHVLAKKHKNWVTYDKDILSIKNSIDLTVAHELAYHSNEKFWTTNDPEILKMQDKNGNSVAHFLTYFCDITGWSTNNKEVLKLQNFKKTSVAHLLAQFHPTWTTNDPEILKLTDREGKTVKNILKEENKI